MFASEPGCGTKTPPPRTGRRNGVVAIVTAMPEEFGAIATSVSSGERQRLGKLDRGILLRGRISGAPVLLAMTGDGEARAERGLSFLLGESTVSLLVGAGSAGALVPSLRPDELVVSEKVVDANGEAPAPDPGYLARAIALGARPATILSAGRPICSSTERRVLAARHGVSDSALAAVDMESAAWARTAASRGVPWVILRAVSDTFDEDLPGFLASCLGADGSVDRAAVARKLLFHPRALPGLLARRRRVRSASGAVGVFLSRFLSASL